MKMVPIILSSTKLLNFEVRVVINNKYLIYKEEKLNWKLNIGI